MWCTLTNWLQHVQNTAAHIVSRTKGTNHIIHVLRSLHWVPVEHRITFKILLLTYKALNGLDPSYIQHMVKTYLPVRGLRSENQFLLVEPKSSLKTFGDRAYSVKAPSLWNKLPFHLRCPQSLGQFKKNLKTHLFNIAYPDSA